MAIDGTLPINWANSTVSFTTTNTTIAKVLVGPNPAGVVASVTGETALPYETAVRQRIQQGGCLIIDGLVSSTDSTARNLVIYTGNQTTLYANMGAPTITSSNIINRTVGSFVTDGYQVGDNIMIFGDTVQTGNNGLQNLIVTTVTALALTVNGTPLTNETSAAGFYVCRVAQTTNKAIAASSGNNGTSPAVALIGGLLDPRTQNNPYGIELGATGLLIVAMAATISALPAQVSVSAHYGLF